MLSNREPLLFEWRRQNYLPARRELLTGQPENTIAAAAPATALSIYLPKHTDDRGRAHEALSIASVTCC